MKRSPVSQKRVWEASPPVQLVQITRASAELRQLEAHRYRVAKNLTPEEVEQLVIEHISDAGLSQRARYRTLLEALESTERSVLA